MWFQKELGTGSPSAHFGHANKLGLTGVALFIKCMQLRLPQLAAAELRMRMPEDQVLRLAVADELQSDMDGAEMFDPSYFRSLL